MRNRIDETDRNYRKCALVPVLLFAAGDTELVGGDTVDLFESLGEVGVTGVGEVCCNICDALVGVLQQEFCVLHFYMMHIL